MCHVNIIFIIPILQKGKLRLNNQIIHPSSKSGSWNQIFSYHLLCFFHRSQYPINTCWVGQHWKQTCSQCLLYVWAERDLGQCWEQKKISWEVKWGSREFTVKWWRLAILPLPLTHPSPCEIWSYILTKKKKKTLSISRQDKSSWDEDSLAISIEPKPTENRKGLRQTIHPFKPDLPNQGSFSLLFQLAALLPAADMLNHPPVPQLMAHKALCSSNPLIAWSCISVTVANSLPNWNLIIFLYKSQQGSQRNCKPSVNPFPSHLP